MSSTHRGAGTLESAELLVRQVLLEGLVELAGDDVRMSELFERADDLDQGSQTMWTADLKAAVRRMVTSAPVQGGVLIGVGYPNNAAVLPFVSIIAESAAEDAGGATMGDILHRFYETVGTPSATDPSASRSVRHLVTGVDYTTAVQVGTWTTAPEDSLALHAVVRHLLFRHKGRMVRGGVRELSFSENGFAPSSELYPYTGYVPVLRCTIEWTLRQTRRTSPVPTRVTMRSGTFRVLEE